MRALFRCLLVLLGLLLVSVASSYAFVTLTPQAKDTVSIRGHQQTVSI